MTQCMLSFCGALLLIPSALVADEIVVPDDFVTIQAAVDFASPGDRVWVRSGTYVENILVIGKSIQLISFDGPEVTIIDGSTPMRPDTLSVVTAIEVEDFILAGFTLRNARGGIDFGDQSGDDSGAGLACGATNGAIRNCIIEGNFCGGSGGGIHLVLSDLRVEDCVVSDNSAGGNGGGVHIFVGSPIIQRCAIERNQALGGGGGGISMAYFASPQITDCVVSENSALSGAGIQARNSSSPTIVRTLVTGNATDALGSGGGISLSGGGTPRIEGCTVVGNSSPLYAGVAIRDAQDAVLSRSIVAFNRGGVHAIGLICAGSTLAVDCCNVFGNEGGDELCGFDAGGNFSLDPLLCSDYSIAATSPCAPQNSPAGCGLIGALAVGCTEAIAPATWGGIKVRYHD